MNILCIGDPHVKIDNLHLFDLLQSQLETVFLKYTVNMVVILGDLMHYHEKLYTLALNRARNFVIFLSSKAKHVFVLVGNHDYINNSQFLSQNHWMNVLKDIPNVQVADEVLFKFNCVFCPYVPPGRFEEALNTIGNNWKEARFIFAHQEFHGCSMGSITSHAGDRWNESYPMVISGHIHDRQRLQTNIYYPGSSIQHTFSEGARKQIILLQGEDIVEIPMVFPTKRTIYTHLHETIPKNVDSNTRIVIKGNYDHFKIFQKTAEYTNLLSQGAKIVFKPEIEEQKEMNTVSFSDVLYERVTELKDEFIYAAYQKIVHHKDIDPEKILII
jgi:DNA repair exonuclease SbcCD nuclease subunit